MFRYKIALDTTSDIVDFVRIASADGGKVQLIDGTGYCVSGKSLLGTMAAIEWSSLYCESEHDLYSQIQKYCV